MPEPACRPWTVEEFLTWERSQQERCELVDQMIRFLPDEPLAHAMITGNLLIPIMGYLRADPAGAHALVVSHSTKVVADGCVLYPDLAASCARQDPRSDILADPVLIAEVVSRRSAAFDRGGKWRAYQSIASLADFYLVSQDEALVEHYSRKPGGWDFRLLAGLDAELSLSGLNLRLPLRDIYAGSAVPSA